MSEIRLDRFDHSRIDRGRSLAWIATWFLVRPLFLDTPLPWPSWVRRVVLRLFGAKVGRGVAIRTRVYVHYPWRLQLGDHCWIGDGCRLLSVASISIGAHAALGHEVFLAAGSHEIRSRSMAPKNEPIVIGRGCWLASRVFVGPGVTIADDTVVSAGTVVLHDLPAQSIAAGSPARVVAPRTIDRD